MEQQSITNTTESPSNHYGRKAVHGVATLVMVGTVSGAAFYVGNGLKESTYEPMPQVEDPIATATVITSEPTSEASDAAESATAASAPAENAFTVPDLGCFTSSIVSVDAKLPVTWVGTLQADGTPYKSNVPGLAQGQAEIKTCLAPEAIVYDAATSEQTGVATYSVDSSATNLAYNAQNVAVGTAKYSKNEFYTMMHQTIPEYRRIDARRDTQNIRMQRDVVVLALSNAVRRALNSGQSRANIDTQSVTATAAELYAAAGQQGIAPENIMFNIVNTVQPGAATFADNLERPKVDKSILRIRHKKASVNLTVTGVTQ